MLAAIRSMQFLIFKAYDRHRHRNKTAIMNKSERIKQVSLRFEAITGFRLEFE